MRAFGSKYEEVKVEYSNDCMPWMHNRKEMKGVLFHFADYRTEHRWPGQTRYAILLPDNEYKQLVKMLEMDPMQIANLYRKVFPGHANIVGKIGANKGLQTTLDFKGILFIRDSEHYMELRRNYCKSLMEERRNRGLRG